MIDPASAPPATFGKACSRALAWARREPAAAALACAVAAVFVYFYGFYAPFMDGGSTLVWAWRGWNTENDQQHCMVILPLAAWVLWYHRAEFASARCAPGNGGLAIIALGLAVFVFGARCLQPRFALVSLPLLTYGAAVYLGGWQLARTFIFPALLMLLLVPMGGIIQQTVSMNVFAASVVGKLSALLGIQAEIIGSTIKVNGHPFDVIGGCSGIRSLMAMLLLAAIYVHFWERGAVKQWLIFGSSIVFAIIGNIARLFAIVLVARFYDPKFAGDAFHNYSAIIFFPVAVLAMLGFANVLNHDWDALWRRVRDKATAPEIAPAAAPSPAPSGDKPAKPGGPISYDY